MRPLPSSKYSLPRGKKPLHKALKREEKKIRKAYSSIPFSPAVPECTPIRAYFDLYSCTDPEVLYHHLVHLNRRAFFKSLVNDTAIGIISGVFSSLTISATVAKGTPFWVSLILGLILAVIYSGFIILFLNLIALNRLPPLSLRCIDMMYDILKLDKYFDYK